VQAFDVNGTAIPPSFSVDWDVTIAPEIEYTAVTSVGGNINGATCFNVIEQSIFCPRVIVPGETPPDKIGRALL